MPNQEPPKDPQNDTTELASQPTAMQDPSIVATPNTQQTDPLNSILVHNDLPPLPDFMVQDNVGVVPEKTTDVLQKNEDALGASIPPTSLPNESFGSAAPSDLPPMVASPKKKFGGKKIVATILGIFLLVGGVGAGIILTQQQQLFQQKAAGTDYGAGCVTGLKGNIVCGSTNVSYDPNNPLPGVNSGYQSEEDAVWGCGGGNYSQGPNGNYYCGSGESSGDGGTSSTPTPGTTIVCQNIKAYNSNWTLLTSTELSALTSGTVINFCASGTASTGSFDKAQFTITSAVGELNNSDIMPETTTKRPNSSDFCQSYTIPVGAKSISATAKIHHATLGWK
jgi:hypothetical protein